MDEREQRKVEELSAHSGPNGLSTGELLQQITSDARSLVQMEVELARAEARKDLNAEMDLAKGAVVAAVCALVGINMLIVAIVLSVAPTAAWMVALGIGILLLVAAATAALIGWRRAQKHPLGATRESLKEDLEWAKRQVK